MKSFSAVLPALCIGLFATPIACGGMAVQSYIDNAKTSTSLQNEIEPPPCANGEEGKNAIIKAFRDSGPKPPGVLPLATFVSLSCYRVKQVQKAIGDFAMTNVYKANVPADKDMVDTMIAAWSATSDEASHDTMRGQFLMLDAIFVFQVYAGIQKTDKPMGLGIGHPKGTYFPIEGASKEETETMRKAWCQYVAPGALERFLNDKLPPSTDTSLMRDIELTGLIGNQCTETDQALLELIKRVDKNADAQEDQWVAKEGKSRATFVSESRMTLNKDATGYPLISRIGKDSVFQGKTDPNRTKHYLDVLTKSGHSCAFGADIKSGIDAGLVDHPELNGSIGESFTAYKEFLKKTCGDLP